MSDPTLVFTEQRGDRSQIVVNFGVFSGREATEAEIARLGQSLLDDLRSVEIIAERRFEFDHELEATIHHVRVLLPPSADDRTVELSARVEDWARESIGERSRIAP
jgi:hypothetical protein